MVALRTPLLLVLAALLAFGGGLVAPFHLDDHALPLAAPLGVNSPWTAVFRLEQTRPLTWLTLWANLRISPNPFGFHLVSLVLHACAVLACWIALRRILPERAVLIATALFALHPLQTEAVVYVFARATLLYTLFCLLAFSAWIVNRRWAAVALFALALLAKEEAVTFPVFLVLLHFALKRTREDWPPLITMFGLALAAGLRVAWAAAVIAGSGAGTQAGITPFGYFTAQGLAILRYLWLILVPLDLTIEPALAVQSALLASLAWIAIAALSILALRRFTGAREGFWLIAGFVLLAPSSSVFPAADLAADRRMYFPLVAFGAVAGLLLYRVRLAILAPLAALLAVLSFAQTRLWQTEQGLWMEAARLAPKHIRPKRQLARLLPPQQALVLLEEARQLAPGDPRIATDLGRVYLSLGQPVPALEQFGRALAAEPNSAEALNNRGVALLMLGQTEAARQDFLRALEKDPRLPDALHNLSRLPK